MNSDQLRWKTSDLKQIEVLEYYEASSYSIEVVKFNYMNQIMLKIEREIGLTLVFIGLDLEHTWNMASEAVWHEKTISLGENNDTK